MKQFESRNVLDRIETTWNMFFSSAWKVRVLPQIVFTAVGNALGILSFAPLFFLFPSFMIWDTLDSAGQMFLFTKTLLLLLIPITIFTFVYGMIYTYTLTILNDYEKGRKWKQYIHIAWSRLWGWAWYGLWITLFILTLVGLGSIFYIFLPEIGGFILFFLILLFFWLYIPLYVGAPGYILENSWSPRGFLDLYSMTRRRWWRTVGNIFLGGMVVSLILSLFTQFASWMSGWGGLWIWFGLKMSSMENQQNIDWNGFFSDMPEIGVGFIIGTIILYIIWAIQKVFIQMFLYNVWKEIVTDFSEDGRIEKVEGKKEE